IYTEIDAYSIINTNSIHPANPNFIGGFIETSAHTLNLLGTINAGRGGMWLIDPTNITISSANSTGGATPTSTNSASNLAAAQGQAGTSVFNVTDIQNAINSGTSVTISGTGTITQTTALSFNITSAGLSPTLTITNASGSRQSITLIAMTDNSTGSGSRVNLQVNSSGGAIVVNGVINLKGSVALDNTFGCAGTGCTPLTDYLNRNLTNWAASVTTAAGVTVNSAINASAITINGISGTTNNGISLFANLTARSGNISLTGTTTSGYGLTNFTGASWGVTTISADSGAVTLNGFSTGAGWAIRLGSSSLISARSITVFGSTATGGDSIELNAMTIVAGGGHLTVTSRVGASTSRGITQAGAITNNAAGSNISFISNGVINQTGTISLVANTTGTAASITYDATSDGVSSSITTGALSVLAGTNNSAINYSVLSSGSAITIGGVVNVPGIITLDNTYGCAGSGCTPVTGYLNRNLSNWTTLVTTSAGITINSALTGSAITINGITSTSNNGVATFANLTATAGNITINGTSVSGYGVTNFTGAAWAASSIFADTGAININGIATTTGFGTYLGPNNHLRARSITVVASTATGSFAAYLNALSIVASGTNLNVTGTVGVSTNTGIYQTGAITNNAPGSNIRFISNGSIEQRGAIALVANTTANTANITYNTTSGDKGANILTGSLTIAAGTNASPINYSVLSSGSGITISGAVSVPGTITLDNTFGCATTGCTPASGYLNRNLANWATSVTTSSGVIVNGALNATAIAINGITSTSNNGVSLFDHLTATTGNISVTGTTNSGFAITNLNATTWTVTNFTANSGAVNLTGFSTTTGMGIRLGPNNLISARSITVFGNSVGGDAVGLNAMTIVAGGNDLTVNGIVGTSTNRGISQSGAITNNAPGSNISFISNGIINQTGAIAVVANTTGTAASITYDATSDGRSSSITTGALTIASGTNNSPINYIIKASGAAINPGAIGSSTVALPGYVLLDNTYGCSGTGCVPVTGFINATTNNLASLATSSIGVTINNAIFATGNITANGASNTSNGVQYTVDLVSTRGNVTLNGATVSGYGVYTSTSLITANNIVVTGASSSTPAWVVYLGPLTINSASTGGSITVTGHVVNTPGNNGGIYQAGVITGANGSNISFISNNQINQAGTINLVANTSGASANIIYDVTTGNRLSTITTGTLSLATGSTSPINYIQISSGSNLNPGAIGATVALPGYVLLDNTYGCAGSGCTPVAGYLNRNLTNWANFVTTSAGVTINNAIVANDSITINGITGTSNNGVALFANLTSSAGSINITGTTSSGSAITNANGSAWALSNLTANSGAINLTGFATTTGWGIRLGANNLLSARSITVLGNTATGTDSVSLNALTIVAGGEDLTVTGTAGSSTNRGISQSGAITNNAVGSNITFISNGGISQTGAITVVANTTLAPANITYNTTSGDRAASITTGTVTVASGSNTSPINYIVRSNGATLSVPAVAVPGHIILDNTCSLCATVNTAANASANGNAITITGSLSAGALAGTTGIRINAIANGTGTGFTQGANTLTSSSGGITIVVNGQTGTGYSSTGALSASGQAVSIATTTTTGAGINQTGAITAGALSLNATQSVSTATGIPITATGQITANSLTVNASGGAPSTIVSLGAITINAGGGHIFVTANNATSGSVTGINQTGAITNNAIGSSIVFVSNNSINQTGAITLVANTGAPAANLIYDTTSGARTSTISTGALTFTSGAGSVINYVARSAGAAITTAAIGTSTLSLPGTVTIDNTFGCSGTGCTVATGFITAANVSSTLASASAGVTISGGIYASGNILINGVSSGAAGVSYSAPMASAAGNIAITGITTTGSAISGTSAGILSATSTTLGTITLTATNTTANGVGISSASSATITGAAGVYLYTQGTGVSISVGALVRNSGTAGGVVVNATGNVSLAGVTNSGAAGIRITGGQGIAGGTTTGGTVTAVGTLSNTGGVIGISMAAPENASCTSGCTVANAIGITTANADVMRNISYGVAGGAMVNAVNYVAGTNFINYRQRLTNTINVTLNADYSAVYGTGFNSSAASTWLRNNSTVTLGAFGTSVFGLTASSLDYARSVLVFSPTVGGTSATNGTNANAVQTNTALTAASVSAADGSTVVFNPNSRRYTITPAVLGIHVTATYNGTTTFTNRNSTITTTGLASWDTITSVTVNVADANGASTMVTNIAGTASIGTFASTNYLINTSYNGSLSNSLPVNNSQDTATNRVVISPAPLGISINAVYSGSTTVTPTSFGVTGLVNNQTITGISSATINAVNVAANNSNFVTALTVSAGTASMANYSITTAYNAIAGNTQNTVILTPKALTVSGITIAPKTYDGTATASITAASLVGVALPDISNVQLSQVASFTSVNAANNVPLDIIASISGTAAANYTLVNPSGITANISPRTLTIGGTPVVANKVYDGTTVASVSGGTLVGVIAADTTLVRLVQAGHFAQSNVGNNIAVVMNNSLSGIAANNYVITQPTGLTANITPRNITITGTVVTDKVYDGTTGAVITGGSLLGVLASDLSNVSLSQTGTFTSANAARGIAVNVTSSIAGSASANYNLQQVTGITGNITPAPLGITLSAVYSGSTTVTPSTFTVTGLVNRETITSISSAVVANINLAGNDSNFVRSIVIGGGTALASNYALNTVANSSPGTTLNRATLTPRTLTVTGTVADAKVYDGTSNVNIWGGTLVGVVGADIVSLRQSGTLTSANVGSAVPVTVNNSISGPAAGNYTLVQPSNVTAVVRPKVLTISDGIVANKVYDGTDAAVITGGSLVGLISSDVGNVTLIQSGRFSSPNVSNGIIILASNTITGSAASNYTLAQPTGITANITPARLGITVVGIANGTNTVTPASFTITGLIGGQTITSLSAVSVASPSIASNGSNYVTGIVISGGTALATNYSFSPSYNATPGVNQNVVTLVNQNQRILTVVDTVAVAKTYDGTTAITLTGGRLVGVAAGDSVTLSQSGVLLSANVGSAVGVAVNNTISGASASNYILVQPTGVTAVVNPAPLGIIVEGVYNGTNTITPTSFTLTGLVNSETVTGLSSATLNATSVASNGSNFVTSLVSSGGTAVLSNYRITPTYNNTAGTTRNVATITPKSLTVGGTSVAANKVYDGTTVAAVSGGSLVGLIAGDVVNLTQAGTFARSTVGTGITVTGNNSISGPAAVNYTLVQPTGMTANITPKPLTITGASVADKVYDGSTTAVVTGGTLSGLVGLDGANVTLSQSASFASANAGNNITVTFNSSISGTAASNYTLVQPNSSFASITPKLLTVSGTVVSNKVYDGTTNATVTAGNLVGVVSTDAANVTLTRAGSFTSANVGTAIPISLNHSISGSAASNYTLTQPTGVTANITPKALTITANNLTSTYGDTTNLGTSAFTQSGLVSGDSINAVTILYNNSNTVAATVNAGTYNNSIIPSAATGTGLSNYNITYVAGRLVVDPATLTVTPIAQSVVYSGNTLNTSTYSANAANYAVTGYKNSDSANNVSLAFTGSLGFTLNGSSATVLNAGTYSYSAGNLAMTTTNTNYRVVLASSLTNQYVITPAIVSLSASKTYDGTATFTAGASGTNFTVTTGIGSQTLTLSGTAAADSANVIGVTSLNTSGLSLGNGTGLASNYVLPASTGNVVINPKTITVSISGTHTKVYDSSTLATLIAGTSLTNGSYTLSGFVGNDGAYINQTIGNYNSPNVANANSITAIIGSSYVARGSTVLSNYTLPTTASTTTGNASITRAPLIMTANDASTFVGVAPTLTYQLNGLVGSDTANTAISSPTVTYSSSLLNSAVNAPIANALTPNATSANYSLTFVKGSLMVAGNYQMVINPGSNTVTYGLINSGNLSYLGNTLTVSSNVSAGYCTNCGEPGVTSPNIVNLTVLAPALGSNVWTASDSLGSGPGTGQGKYTFVIAPTVPVGSYSSSDSLKVGNYVLSANSLTTVAGFTTNYDPNKPVIYNSGNLTVVPKTLTVTGTTVANKVYDSTNLATVSGGQLVGQITGDLVGLTQSGVFASKNVGSGISVTVTDALLGADIANYTLTQPSGLTANITPAPVTVSGLSADNKVYDAATSAVLKGTATITGVFAGDTVNITSGSVTGAFASANVGNGIAINANTSALTISNSNYFVNGLTTALTANITPAAITVSAAKTYDGSQTLTANQMTVTGVAGQVLSFAAGSSATLTSPNVGSASLMGLNNPVLVDGTGLATNYTIDNPIFGSVTITPAAITVSASPATKVYDRTTSVASAVSAPTLVLRSGTLFMNQGTGQQDTLSGGVFVYADANAGSGKTLNVSNASVVSGPLTVTGNYTINFEANTTSLITPAPVTVSGLSADNKVYNANSVAILSGTPTVTGILAGDSSSLSGSATAGTFASANVGTGIAVTANLGGLSLSNTNYYVAGVTSPLRANITAAPVTISGLNASNKVYDTTDVATLTGTATLAGVISGDNLSITAGNVTAVFASNNVGTGIAVTANLAGLSLSNSNYYIAGLTSALSADITAAPLTISGLSAANKVYDRSNSATITGTPVIASGLLGTDVATLSGSVTAGTFATMNVGTGIAVTPNLGGLSLSNSNYYIANLSSSLSANITPASVTISGLTASNKVYDASNVATLSGTPTIVGLISGDSASLTGSVTAVFASTNVGTGIAITPNVSGLTISNSNYQITGLQNSLTANITPAPLTVTAENKSMVYGSSLPNLTYVYTGLVGNETSAVFTGGLVSNATSSASVGNAYTITQGTLAATGNWVITVLVALTLAR
ncbi:MAG: hypothetical protein EBS31_02835, partial [Burkholderiaceae bacterium]|nr:hypothetical protein [Burkholderiaceae bacterium]